ncbi:MAG: acetoacetate-CoA ligase [Bacillus thermozeamaize]|uniref:Acetoacetate-CoA ligase n=1 Tax=Bacillus thermozeamaize TaxID=230954 RepID=A0A1Y3PRY0_9BACI|nr:MAG: acetoacetate-CoA ligase [Bacillus thermozeamaize]
MATISEGTLLWEPTEERKKSSGMFRYMQWLGERRGLAFDDYHALWQWSVDQLEDFWETVWEYTQVQASVPYTKVLEKREMPGARWFTGARLNYAEHIFRNFRAEKPALFFRSEHHPLTTITWDELRKQTASVSNALKRLGVKPGDRVVAYMPNIPQTVIAFLACASIGAVWSSCSPDFGTPSVIDRFKQIEPKILFAVDGYRYNGKPHDRMSVVADLQAALPSLEKTVLVPYLDERTDAKLPHHAVLWDDLLQTDGELSFEQVPFDHPLWVLYSSGTTGLPKPIVQGQGGILIEQLKSFVIQNSITEDDRFFWFTTTGWMMWNFLVGTLLAGAAIILYDGSPAYPDIDVLWDLAEKSGMTYFGTSAGYIATCMKAGADPGKKYDLSKLKALGSTGSPLTPEGFAWVYEHVKQDLWLASASGGTDVCTAFVGGSPLLPVRAGEIQCRSLGVKVEAFDEQGQPLIDEVGELVVTEPMPSMPLYFWNDPDGRRYKESYFDMYPGVWRHGDWIKITSRGSCIIYGRSDSTINRHGVRMGTSEIYQAVESLDEVLDSLIVDLELLGRPSFLPLFVVLKPGVVLDEQLKAAIKDKIRKEVSPRHVPDEIYAVEQIPRTLNGKKMEVPIRRILLGHPLEKAVNPDSMSNPESLPFFIELAKSLNEIG